MLSSKIDRKVSLNALQIFFKAHNSGLTSHIKKVLVETSPDVSCLTYENIFNLLFLLVLLSNCYCSQRYRSIAGQHFFLHRAFPVNDRPPPACQRFWREWKGCHRLRSRNVQSRAGHLLAYTRFKMISYIWSRWRSCSWVTSWCATSMSLNSLVVAFLASLPCTFSFFLRNRCPSASRWIIFHHGIHQLLFGHWLWLFLLLTGRPPERAISG